MEGTPGSSFEPEAEFMDENAGNIYSMTNDELMEMIKNSMDQPLNLSDINGYEDNKAFLLNDYDSQQGYNQLNTPGSVGTYQSTPQSNFGDFSPSMPNNYGGGMNNYSHSVPQSPYSDVPSSPFSSNAPHQQYNPMNNNSSNQFRGNNSSSQQQQAPEGNPLRTSRNGQAITELNAMIETVTKSLEKLRRDQKQVALPISHENYAQLDDEQRKLRNSIDWIDKTLNNLMDNMHLESNEMNQILLLEQELHFFSKQLGLYCLELQNFQKDGTIPCYGLHIVVQPFPDSVKQHKAIDENLAVRLLSGAKFDTRPACTIRAEILDSSSQKSGGSKKSSNGASVENGEKLINESGIATFNDLKFPTGTRLKSIRLKFSARFNVSDSRGAIHTVSIESEPTNAIVVKTNENQWHEAEGILLKKTAFANFGEISWHRFSNWLQRRYLGATKQNVHSPVRPLSTYDFQYIHALKFDNKPIISQKHFDNFWQWFGPLLHKIRYQRHVLALWTRGYICGFLTREEVESVLKNEQIGTFLIRVSERCDQFAVSYQSAEMVKHYLVKNDDTHGAKRTLPDFLRDYKDFACILQLSIDKATNKRILRRCDKESVLKEFYSKKAANSSPGYEEVISVQ